MVGASFNPFRNHIWGPFLRDMVNISLREQFIHNCQIAAISTILSLKLGLPLSLYVEGFVDINYIL